MESIYNTTTKTIFTSRGDEDSEQLPNFEAQYASNHSGGTHRRQYSDMSSNTLLNLN